MKLLILDDEYRPILEANIADLETNMDIRYDEYEDFNFIGRILRPVRSVVNCNFTLKFKTVKRFDDTHYTIYNYDHLDKPTEV